LINNDTVIIIVPGITMSGHGRGYQNQYRGRGRFNNNGRSNNNFTNNKGGRGMARKSDHQEMKFTPFYAGKQQGATFDTVRDYLFLQMQKTFRDGKDIVQSLRDNTDDFGGADPVRLVSGEADATKNKVEQDGFDIDYKEERRTYNNKKDIFESNKIKAYALIFENCNKTMQSRIEECTDFETVIRDNPRVLLNEIKKKMYDPARAKYEFATLTESLRRILETKQDDDEGLVEYTKW